MCASPRIIDRGFRKPLMQRAIAATLALGLAFPVAGVMPNLALAQTGNVTIEASDGNTGVTYSAYKIFSAEVDATNTIKNISWASDAVQEAVVGVITSVDSSYTNPSNSSASAQKAAEFIQEHIAGSNGTAPSQESTLILDADTFGMKLADAIDGLTVAATLKPGEATALESGYYLFITTNDSITTAETGTSPIFAAIGASAVTIQEKDTVPTLTKRALDEAGNEQLAVDAFVGQSITYELTGTMPANIASYATYSYQFTDKLGEGITANPSSVEVYIDGVNYTKSFETSLADNTLTIQANDLLAIANVTASSQVKVRYTAALNTSAVTGSAGNDNVAALTYSSNPNNAKTVTSTEKHVRTYTYELDIHKQDKQDASRSLSGAQFTVQITDNANAELKGKYVQADGTLGEDPYTFETGDGGNVSIKGIDQGTYLVSEVGAPTVDNGSYQTISPVTVTIDSNVEELGEKTTTEQVLSLSATANGGSDAVIAWAVDASGNKTESGVNATSGKVNMVVRDTKRTLMPATGDAGIALPCFVAVGALGVSICALRARKHMRSRAR